MCIFAWDDDVGVEVMGRSRLDAKAAYRLRMKYMVVMRSQGYSDREIGMVFRVRRETVNRYLRSMPSHVSERLRAIGLV